MQEKYKTMIKHTIISDEFQAFVLTEDEPLMTLEVGLWVLSEKQLTVQASKDTIAIEKIGIANGFIIEEHRWIDIKIKPSEENKTADDQTDHKAIKSICERDMKPKQLEFKFDLQGDETIKEVND